MEKTLRENLSARRDSLVHQYKTCLADSSILPNIGTVPIYSSPSRKSSPSSSPNVKILSSNLPLLNSPILPSVKEETLIRKVLRNSTPKTEVPLLDLSIPIDMQNCHVLSPLHTDNSLKSLKYTHFLPSMFYTEWSNVVQDQESDDECYFKIQDTHKNPARDSLHAEISQVFILTKKFFG